MPGGVAGERPIKAAPYADGLENERRDRVLLFGFGH
jgi:hypothetical protein